MEPQSILVINIMAVETGAYAMLQGHQKAKQIASLTILHETISDSQKAEGGKPFFLGRPSTMDFPFSFCYNNAMKQYHVHKLKNNLTVIICRYPNFNSLYFDLAIKVGSRYENKNNNGLSHLVEHLLQKKTINSLKSHPWIKHYINNNFRAYSMKDRTNFESSAHKDDLTISIQFLAEILKGPNITREDIEIERKIILEELSEHKSEAADIYFRLVDKLYYKNNPLSFEILGSKNSLSKLTLSDVNNFIGEYYQPENIILTIAGDTIDKKIIQLVNRYFKFPSRPRKNKNNFQKYIYPGDNLHIINQKGPQNYFSFSCPIFNHNAKENVKWDFFVEILDNYLFYTIKDKLFCYSINTDSRTYVEFFDFFIESSFAPQKTASFYSLLHQTLKGFKGSLNEKGFEYYKNKKLITMDINKDYPAEFANMAGWHALMFGADQALGLSEQQKIIKSITLKDIYYYFDQLFSGKRGMIVISGNVSKIQEQKIRKKWKNWKI